MDALEFAPADRIPPEEAFRILGHEIRVDVVAALYDAGGPEGPGRLGYAELKNRVGVRDSSKFNYHLDELRGVFVREYDAGYGLTYAGQEAYRVVATGLYHGRTTAGPVDLDADCPCCGAALELSYADDRFSIGCSGCSMRFADVPFAVEAAMAHEGSLLSAVDARLKGRTATGSRDVCPHCGGPIAGGLVTVAELPFDPGPGREVFAMRQCDACGGMLFSPVGAHLVHHPAAISFYERRGRDLLSTYAWELPFVVSDDPVTVENRDPPRAVVELALDGETLELAVDEDLSVTVRE